MMKLAPMNALDERANPNPITFSLEKPIINQEIVQFSPSLIQMNPCLTFSVKAHLNI